MYDQMSEAGSGVEQITTIHFIMETDSLLHAEQVCQFEPPP